MHFPINPYLSGIGVASLCDWHSKVLHEVCEHAQFTGKYKVIERPQLLEVILYRRSREDDSVIRPVRPHEHWWEWSEISA